MTRHSLLIQFIVFVPLLSFGQLKGKVIAIANGDTFTILTDDRQHLQIGLFGVDSPEMSQDYSHEAKDYLGDLIFFDTVQVMIKGKDDSGRTLGVVTMFNINVNERMLQKGLAWHDIKADNNPLWTAYEKKAKQFKKGLWSKPNPIPPWQWRNTHKN